MGSGGRFLYYLLLTLAVALITYNAIISSTAILLNPGFPGRRGAPPSRSSSDPVVQMPFDRRRAVGRRPFHTAVTASDSVYNAWQCRVMYYWFKKVRDATPESEMGGFTRILHSGRPDKLVDEIPTFVADPLPAGTDQVIELLYFLDKIPPSDLRDILFSIGLGHSSSGFRRLISRKSKANTTTVYKILIYILMAEPDHIIVKPIPNLAKAGLGAAFPFFYIEPKKFESVLRKYYPEDRGQIADIDPIGNSPVIIEKLVPDSNINFITFVARYAYAVASALNGVGNILHKDFMIQ
ncbi:hypothetical protein B296_00050333, partial [Ensete ventricosum]